MSCIIQCIKCGSTFDKKILCASKTGKEVRGWGEDVQYDFAHQVRFTISDLDKYDTCGVCFSKCYPKLPDHITHVYKHANLDVGDVNKILIPLLEAQQKSFAEVARDLRAMVMQDIVDFYTARDEEFPNKCKDGATDGQSGTN